MKNKKNIFIVVLILLAFGLGVLYSFNKEKIIELEIVTNTSPEKENQIKSNSVKESPKKGELKNKITLNVFNKSYLIETEEGVNVYDAMKSIKDSNFSFKTKKYSGLGYFVDEINGVKGAPGKYWIYFVNDKEASVGISEYILKDGDIIKWSQEGI